MKGAKNFNQVLLNNFSKCADMPAMMFKEEGVCRTITYQTLEGICLRIATGLIETGLHRGDRIAVFSRNGPKWAHADLGSILAGAITSAIYASAIPDEVEFIIQDLEASFIFVEGPSQVEKLLQIRKNIPSVKKVFVFDETLEHSDPWIAPFSSLITAEEPSSRSMEEIREIADATEAKEPMCIIYTSGTTGRPKGVVLTHSNYVDTIEMMLEHISDTEKLKRNLSFLPLAHAFERFAGYYQVLYMGRCIAYVESLETIMENFKEMKPNFVVGVPRFFESVHARIIEGVQSAPPIKRKLFNWAVAVGNQVSRHEISGRPLPLALQLRYKLADYLIFRKVRDAFGGEIEFFVSGGAPLSKELAEFFHAMGILILEGWGATEATTPTTFNRPHEYRFGSVGKPLPRVQVRVKPDGELEVKGPNVFKEYWKNPEETKDTFTPDGFYRTGDIGIIDEDGWVYIIDRKKQLIITSGGKNIAPAPIEILLSSSRQIEMAYVQGDNRHYLTALLVLNQHAIYEIAKKLGIEDLSWTDLLNHPRIIEEVQKEVDRANEQLAKHMQVKDFRILSEPFSIEGGEMTHTMKLKRKVIEEKNRDLLGSMYM